MIHTKRLYRLDEVRAAFLFCLLRKRLIEAIFWLRELEDSCFGGEARRLLLVSWTMTIGLSRISWLISWSSHGSTREGRLRICWQLLHCSERDSSIWWLLWLGVIPIGDGYSSLLDRWNSVCHLDGEEFWSRIEVDKRLTICMDSLQYDMRGYSILAKAVGVASMSHIPSSSWKEVASSPMDIEKVMEDWESLGMRKGRVYEIPALCLYGMSWRGAGGDTSEDLHTLTDVYTSAYWKRAITYTTDEEKEEFYDTYFMDDIPDEWSLKDRQMSHGPGVPAGPLSRWWNLWISPDHLWIWGKPIYLGTKWIQGQKTDVEASILDRICKLYTEREPREVYMRQKKFVFA